MTSSQKSKTPIRIIAGYHENGLPIVSIRLLSRYTTDILKSALPCYVSWWGKIIAKIEPNGNIEEYKEMRHLHPFRQSKYRKGFQKTSRKRDDGDGDKEGVICSV